MPGLASSCVGHPGLALAQPQHERLGRDKLGHDGELEVFLNPPMRPIVHRLSVFIGALAFAASTADAAAIDCRRIGFAYDDLFRDANARVERSLVEYQGLAT